MKTPSDPHIPPAPPLKKTMDKSIASLMGLGERSVRKSYYPQLQKKIRELEESRRQYKLLAENISDVIWMLAPDFTIRYISPSIRAMSGFDPQELERSSFIDLLVPSHADAFIRLIRDEVLAQGHTREIQVEQRRADGPPIWIEIKASLVTDGPTRGKKILGISRDITTRRSLQDQLLQAQKMESVGTLAGGIAHDFNNLLTVINGYADLGLNKIDETHGLYRNLSVIRQAGRRATHLTRQLLAFSRKQVYTPQPLDINQAIAGMDKILRRLIGEDILVDTLLAKDPPKILADQAQIEQIFTNLVVNARDSLNETDLAGRPKRITIETGRALFPEESRHCRRHDGSQLPDPGQYVFFSVSDNGQGMDRTTRERIFEPFFTTKPTHQGTGLGLATAYGIVHQNRGSIQVYSEPGQGSLFKIYWPISEKAETPTRKKVTTSQDLKGHERILVVEDEESVRIYTAYALISLGYQVDTAPNGQAALDRIKSQLADGTPGPDLVVTDLIMPELNGREFIRATLEILPNLKVIYVSGYTDNHIIQDGILEPGVNYLQKPYSGKDLGKIVRQVLDET